MGQLKMLNLNGALKVYQLIGKHLPEPDSDIYDYLQSMLENITRDGEQEQFVEAFVLMSGRSAIELVNLPHQTMLQLLGTTLIENKILDLKRFCEQIGL